MHHMKSSLAENIAGWAKKVIHPRKYKSKEESNQDQRQDGSPVVSAPVVSHEPTTNDRPDRWSSLRATQLSKVEEELDGVTPASLKCVISSTLKAQSALPTNQLVIHGDRSQILRRTVSAHKIRKLSKACPSLRELAISNLNLCSNKTQGRVSLDHFPKSLQVLSVRDSVVEVGRFLNPKYENSNIRILDLGRSLNLKGAGKIWPRLENLQELYLEGVAGLSCDETMTNILVSSPMLNVLDIEGTDVTDSVFLIVAKFSPHLKKLYVGFTNIHDRAFYHMERKGVTHRNLEILCLADTTITSYGVDRLKKVTPKLRDVTVNRTTVVDMNDVDDVYLPLRVHRTYNVHIGAVFRNQGCEHFKLQRASRRGNAN